MYGLPPDLLNAVALAPDDDTPRLACADWLDEHGDPDAAAFIRAVVGAAALARRHADPTARRRLNAAARALWVANAARWLPWSPHPEDRATARCDMGRGFPTRVGRPWPGPEPSLAELLSLPMLESLRRTAAEPGEWPALAALVGLRVLDAAWPANRRAEMAGPLAELVRLPRLRIAGRVGPSYLPQPEGRRFREAWVAARRRMFAEGDAALRAELEYGETDWTPPGSRPVPPTLFLGTLGGPRSLYALERAAALGLNRRALHASVGPLPVPDLSPVAEAQDVSMLVLDPPRLAEALRPFRDIRRLRLSLRPPRGSEPTHFGLSDILAGLPKLAAMSLDFAAGVRLEALPGLRCLRLRSTQEADLWGIRSRSIVELSHQGSVIPESLASLPALRVFSLEMLLRGEFDPIHSSYWETFNHAYPGFRFPSSAMSGWAAEHWREQDAWTLEREPTAPWSGLGLAVDVPARLGDALEQADGSVAWREWGDAADWPHGESPAVATLREVPRDTLARTRRERLLEGDALAHADWAGEVERLDPDFDSRHTGLLYRGPVTAGYKALLNVGGRAWRLHVAWGAERRLAWRALARRMAASMRPA